MAYDRFSLSGRVAVVTGSGSGLGRATACLFAERGADVVLAGRRREPLEGAAGDVRAIGRRALVVPTDVTVPEQCQRLVSTSLEEFGRLDILVNNAGLGYSKPLEAWTATDWRDLLDVNLAGVWFLSMAAAKEMSAAGGGSIVNVSTAGSASAVPMEAPYIASKAAVDSVTRSMAAAWTPLRVRVNAVAPGAMPTELHALEARKRGLGGRRGSRHRQRHESRRGPGRDRPRGAFLRFGCVELLFGPDPGGQRRPDRLGQSAAARRYLRQSGPPRQTE